MKRIAIIIPHLNDGGAERVAANIGVYFESIDCEVIYFVARQNEETDYKHVGKVIQVPMNYHGYKGKSQIRQLIWEASRLRKLKNKYKIDISISFMPICNLINILSKDKDKIVVSLRSVTSVMVAKNPRKIYHNKWIFRYLYQMADKIVFVSDYCRSDWKNSYGDIRHKTCVIYNPICKPENAKKENELPYGKHAVISVGRLHPIKQQWYLLRVFSEVVKECPDAQLIILGEGQLRRSLEALSKKLGISKNVHFLGRVADVESYLKAAKVFMMTSEAESFCCAILEAMQCGIPVVTNDCPGGIREVFGVGEHPKYNKRNYVTKCGVICPRLDTAKYDAYEPLTLQEKMMANAVLSIFNNDEQWKHMSENCIQNASRFTLDNIGKRWEEEVIRMPSNQGAHNVNMMSVLGGIIGFWGSVIGKDMSSNSGQSGNQDVYSNKYVSYYTAMDRWLSLKEQGISTVQYFKNNGYKKIGIYGMANMANHLLADLEESEIEVVFGIDKRANSLYAEVLVLGLEDDFPKVDAIVVTPIFDFDNIKKTLSAKVSCPVVSLNEVLFGIK